MTSGIYTTFSTTRMRSSNSTRMKWVYHTFTPKITHYVAFVQTVRDNSEGFNKKEITAGKLARKSQGIIGYPSERDFKYMVSNGMIKKCPITSYEITNAHTMFGQNLSGTRGKKFWQNLDGLVMDCIDVTKDFLKLHKFSTIVANLMFVNGTPLWITMSHGLKFVTFEHIPTFTAN